MIDEEKTFAEKGYRSSELKPRSKKKDEYFSKYFDIANGVVKR